MNQAKGGPHQPTVQDETSDDGIDAEYPDYYKDLDAAERQKRQQECLKTSVYVVWQALLEHNEAAADRILQKLPAMKCYRISQVSDHLDKIDDLIVRRIQANRRRAEVEV